MEEALETGDVPTAIKLLRKELKKNGKADEERMLLGELLADSGDYAEATKVWLKGVRKSPLDREYLMSAAKLELMRAEYGPGVAHMGGITSFQNTNEDPDRFRKARLKAAVKALRRAADIQPPFIESDIMLLHALDGLQDWKALQSHVKKAMEIHGRKAILELYEAKAMAGLGKDLEALQLLLRLAEQYPETSEVHAEIAKIAGKMGDTELERTSRRRGAFNLPDFLELKYTDERFAILGGLGILNVHEDDRDWMRSQLADLCPTTEEASDDDESEIRNCLLEHLLTRDAEDSTILLGILCHSHVAHGEKENKAFEILKAKKQGPLLLSILENASSWCTVRGAGFALVELKYPGIFEILVELLPNDNAALYHANVAGALLRLGDARAVEHLAALISRPAPVLHSEDFLAFLQLNGAEANRTRCALALGQFPGEASIAALKKGLNDVHIAPACAAALFRLTGDTAFLEQCLKSLPNSNVRITDLSQEADYWQTRPEAESFLRQYQALVEAEERDPEK